MMPTYLLKMFAWVGSFLNNVSMNFTTMCDTYKKLNRYYVKYFYVYHKLNNS